MESLSGLGENSVVNYISPSIINRPRCTQIPEASSQIRVLWTKLLASAGHCLLASRHNLDPFCNHQKNNEQVAPMQAYSCVYGMMYARVPQPPGRRLVPVHGLLGTVPQEVSGGRASEASSATPHHWHYCLNQHPPPSLPGKIVFHKTGPWCHKGWGPLMYEIRRTEDTRRSRKRETFGTKIASLDCCYCDCQAWKIGSPNMSNITCWETNLIILLTTVQGENHLALLWQHLRRGKVRSECTEIWKFDLRHIFPGGWGGNFRGLIRIVKDYNTIVQDWWKG